MQNIKIKYLKKYKSRYIGGHMSESPCTICGKPAYTVFGSGLCDSCKTKEKIREESEENEERRHKELLEAERERLEAEERRHEELMALEEERLEALKSEEEPVYSSPSYYHSPSPSVYSAPIVSDPSLHKVSCVVDEKELPSFGVVFSFLSLVFILVFSLCFCLYKAIETSSFHQKAISIESEKDAEPVNDGDIVAYEENKFSK